MKKLYLIILFIGMLFVSGCGKKGEDSVVKDLSKHVNDIDKYQVVGILSITNNDDTYSYDVNVSYEKENKFRVSLTNKSNGHEQIILKNETGVYVVTPSLNKSFKFQSDWPYNNSQIYLMQSLIEDIKNDKERKFEEKDNEYIFTTKVNYPNNINLVSQKIWIDKDLNFKKVEIYNQDDIPQMIMEFSNIDLKPTFKDKFYDLNGIIENIEVDENTDPSGALDDIIYPLYIPVGTVLTDKETIAKDKGQRIILTFDGEKPFLLVEETANIEDEFSIIPTFGEPHFLMDTIGALTNNSVTWSSNGVDYYIVSDVMSQLELIEIASSISAIPTMK
jgi:Outer membrane lipoprotein-sorting protein